MLAQETSEHFYTIIQNACVNSLNLLVYTCNFNNVKGGELNPIKYNRRNETEQSYA